jgi:hypothetical protein
MPDPDQPEIPPEIEHLSEILGKILTYQYTLPEDRPVGLEELEHEAVLSSDDLDFLASRSVIYKPHRLSDPDSGDMFLLHYEDGSCTFYGPTGPPLIKRQVSLAQFTTIVENFLKLPKPPDELLLHIEFTEHDGMGVAPTLICFNLRSPEWREHLPALRNVAAEFGFQPFQDNEVQGSWCLTFRIPSDAAHTTTAVIALLQSACNFTNETQITYSAGALDAAS